jgi:hypothetical protein
MSEQLVKFSSKKELKSEKMIEKFRDKYIPHFVEIFQSSGSDLQFMILVIDSKDYVGMLVYGLAQNSSETREIISSQDCKIVCLPLVIGRQILELAYSFLSLEFDSVDKLNLDKFNKPVLIFSDSNMHLTDCELLI